MDKAKIEKLLDNLTLGLKADPEIRLDVKSELRSHLDAKIEEGIQSGLSEKESEKQALKSFGDIIQISDGIAEANSAKMSFKAKLKVFAGILLIPAVIICALISFDPSSMEMRFDIYPYYGFWNFSDSGNRVFCFWERYTPEEKFILYGDKSRKDKAEQQRAIWERFPENKIYLANYILNLLAWNRNRDRNIFTELELAEKIDPDNALYNYIAAGLLLEKAYKTESKRIYYPEGEIWKKEYRKEYSTKINRNLMNQAVEEYLKGTRKKYFKTYTTEMLQERLNIMGKAQSMVESIRQLRFSVATILPYLNHLRSIARDTWKYAELLQKEGKQQKALRIIAPWKKFIKQITEDSNFLIAVLVDMAIVTIGKEKIPEIYRLAGKNNLAKRAEQELTAVFTATNKWKKTPIVRDKKTSGKQALFASNVLAGLKVNFSDTELAVSRKIEYCAIEKLALKVLNAFFMLAMLGALISSFCWKIYSKQKALSLAPSPKLIGKVFIWGVILPLLLYFLISITEFMGGHQYNIWINSPSLIAQMGILLFIILALTFSFAQKHVRQRCRELRVKIPDLKKNKWKYSAVIILCSILGIFAIVPLQSFWETIPPKELLGWGITVIICLLGLSAIFMEEYLVSIFARRKYALYYGSLSRTLVPILALTMILISLVIVPILSWRETDLISRDTVIYGQPESLTPAEQRVVQRLKAAMLKALE